MALMHWTYGVKSVFNLLRTFSNGIGQHIGINDFQLSLIAALYIDSTKQAHARSTFADLLKYTSITDIRLNSQMPMMMASLQSTGTWLSPRNPLTRIIILLLLFTCN
jgi:hypothetical protein